MEQSADVPHVGRSADGPLAEAFLAELHRVTSPAASAPCSRLAIPANGMPRMATIRNFVTNPSHHPARWNGLYLGNTVNFLGAKRI
jgi:hypothetical protein